MIAWTVDDYAPCPECMHRNKCKATKCMHPEGCLCVVLCNACAVRIYYVVMINETGATGDWCGTGYGEQDELVS